MTLRNLIPGIAAFLAAMLVALIGLVASADPPSGNGGGGKREGVVKLRLLGVNDLHGHLQPPRPGIGGAAWLGSHLDRATVPGRTIRVHAGDMVGASPLISSHFHDEPTIEAANQLRFDVGTVGNHEFDEGGDELLRLIDRADFPYLAANTIDRDGRSLLPPYRIVERAGVRVGFIGVTTRSTPYFLLPRHAERFRFTDLSDAVDRWVPELRAQGVEAIVVLAHSGGKAEPGDPGSAAGEIIDETAQMSDAVDVVIAGHSHSLLNLTVPNASGEGGKLVVEALSYGVAYDRVDVTVDRASGDIVEKAGAVPSTEHAGVDPDAGVAALVARYAERIAPLAKRVVGRSDRPLTRANGELGQLAAEAQRTFADTDVGLVNSGSMRADLQQGALTYEEIFAVHPYDFPLVRLRLRGSALAALVARPEVYAAGVTEETVDPGRTYSVTTNEWAATGDAYPPLRAAPRIGDPIGSETDALTRYIERRR